LLSKGHVPPSQFFEAELREINGQDGVKKAPNQLMEA
jgi:hypothetical protein